MNNFKKIKKRSEKFLIYPKSIEPLTSFGTILIMKIFEFSHIVLFRHRN